MSDNKTRFNVDRDYSEAILLYNHDAVFHTFVNQIEYVVRDLRLTPHQAREAVELAIFRARQSTIIDKLEGGA